MKRTVFLRRLRIWISARCCGACADFVQCDGRGFGARRSAWRFAAVAWAEPQLQEAAFEVVEARIDKAEKNIAEALDSEDSRRRDAASFFCGSEQRAGEAAWLDYERVRWG